MIWIQNKPLFLLRMMIPGSLLSDKLLEDFPRNMNMVIKKIEGIFQVQRGDIKVSNQ